MKVKRVVAAVAGVIVLAGFGLFTVAWLRSTNECEDGKPPEARHPMKAVVYCEYGGPEVLQIANIEKPVPTDSQVLVRVRAAAVNPLDWHYMRGTPYIGRMMDMGVRKPKVLRLGTDFAGTVEAVGRSVTQFKPGDEVFGARTGAFAEYVTVRADRVARKPANLTFEQAAAVPISALTALQGLRDQGQVKPGQKVLINGASGGVGTFAVQIAKSLGANVTGVSSTRNVDLVKSLGADRTIDYTKEDFTKGAERYDVIIDNVGNHSLSDLRRVLKPEGTYVMIGGPSGKWVAPFPRVLRMVAMGRFVDQDMKFFIADVNPKDLGVLRDLLQSGTVTPVIDRRYAFNQVSSAVAYLETGRARAKVVITVDSL